MLSFFTGFTVGLSLIVAIGAQNIWVLSQSMAGANRLVIAAVCILCDAALIVVGVYSVQLIQLWLPPLVPVLTWAGVAMLLWLAFGAAKRAWQGQGTLLAKAEVQVQSSPKTAVTALAITLLNPHVYLDTVVLIGSVGSAQAQPFWFTVGACLASLCWFSALTGLAPRLKIWLSSPLRWRLFDGLVAFILAGIALKLAV
ncbi:LysE family transporter [Rheinheimera sp. 1928-s]|uniref:LysE/ArgO family amino acid transporter n=1 Tax=Rheinheimera sp. 1928-s TaxID=3033803 RepID=UPI00262E67E5|nr:LysE family transporter [Rheinheimera sp. 1928-s]MDF3126409.1 LysE family transporter [Rheinheimera sp. 1928-s]